jgi:hypothetical protein
MEKGIKMIMNKIGVIKRSMFWTTLLLVPFALATNQTLNCPPTVARNKDGGKDKKTTTDLILEKLLRPTNRMLTKEALEYLLQRERLILPSFFKEGRVKITSQTMIDETGKPIQADQANFATAIHLIEIDQQPVFFAKESLNCREEASKLQALENRSLFRSQRKNLALKNSERLPLATVAALEKAIFYGDTNRECLLILQAAQGQEVKNILDNALAGDLKDLLFTNDDRELILKMANAIGTRLAAFHVKHITNPKAPFESRYLVQENRYEEDRLTTWIHQDLKFQNMFYEKETGLVTLIDNSEFIQGAATSDISRFLERVSRYFNNRVQLLEVSNLDAALHTDQLQKQQRSLKKLCREFIQEVAQAYTSQYPKYRHKEVNDPLQEIANTCDEIKESVFSLPARTLPESTKFINENYFTSIPPQSDPELEKLLGPKRSMNQAALKYLLIREGLVSKVKSEQIEIQTQVFKNQLDNADENGRPKYATAIHQVLSPSYFVKESEQCRLEAAQLIELNSQNIAKVNEHKESFLPTVNLLVKAISYGPSDRECLLIFQKAVGQNIEELMEKEVFQTKSRSIENILKIATELGKSLGALHAKFLVNPEAPFESPFLLKEQRYKTVTMKTWIHRNLNFSNLFYDPANQHFTFIDNKDFKLGPATFDISRLMNRIVLFFQRETNVEVVSLCNNFLQTLAQSYAAQFNPEKQQEIAAPLLDINCPK